MLQVLENKNLKFIAKLFCVFFVLLIIQSPQNADAISHSEFKYPTPGVTCGGEMTDYDICTCYHSDGRSYPCACPKYATCQTWQTGETINGSCYCAAHCLEPPENPKYYDNNAKYNTSKENFEGGELYQNTDNGINLPIILSWDNIPGWKNLGHNRGENATIPHFCDRYIPNPDTQGPKSYRIQIQSLDDAKNGTYGIENLNLSEAKGLHNESGGMYEKVLQKNAFNSRDDGGACFFQTNSTYRWRVLPCCDANGTDCREDGIQWWTFSTSPAPELLGIQDGDKYKTGTTDDIAQDPDWNGPLALENVDFCSAKLFWCKAKLVEPDAGEYNRFDKVYNESQQFYAFNYQMRVKSSENTSLGALIENIENIPVVGGIVGWIKNSGVVSGIKSKWSNWKNKWSNSTSDCNRWMETGLENAAESETPVGETESESCHYLQKNDDGTCAKPESLSFLPYFDGIANDPTFKPFFSAEENTSRDRNLFTGDGEGKLKYSWQIKPCFTTGNETKPDGTKDSGFPQCGGDVNEDYGQKWQLIGKPMSSATISKPPLTSPAENKNWTSENNLVGLSNTLNWNVPCGANSFLYDIQEESGESIFDGDTMCGADYKNDWGRRFGKCQISIRITDKTTPQQTKTPGEVWLKIDTKYQWHVKSCWPSIPVGEINKICSLEWSDWGHFRTTGRPPNKLWIDIDNDTTPTATFSWEDVPAAGSFNIKIFDATNKEIAPKKPNPQPTNSYIFEYGAAKETYYWQIQTCADVSGKICGPWSNSQPYTTKIFDAPTNLNPGDGEITRLQNLSWSGKANYFKVKLTYSPVGTVSSHCTPTEINVDDITPNNSYPTSYTTCPGNYELTVQPCFDANCEDNKKVKNPISTTEFFIADPDNKDFGFMVCGQTVDNPATKNWDESDKCQPKHLVLITKIIVDFVVFKLAFMLLPVMAAITGGLFYLSQDKANLIPTLKDGWKKVGIGYGILIFAWVIVSILMNLVGYSKLWNQIL